MDSLALCKHCKAKMFKDSLSSHYSDFPLRFKHHCRSLKIENPVQRRIIKLKQDTQCRRHNLLVHRNTNCKGRASTRTCRNGHDSLVPLRSACLAPPGTPWHPLAPQTRGRLTLPFFPTPDGPPSFRSVFLRPSHPRSSFAPFIEFIRLPKFLN